MHIQQIRHHTTQLIINSIICMYRTRVILPNIVDRHPIQSIHLNIPTVYSNVVISKLNNNDQETL